MLAWEGPESKVSTEAIVKGANLCYTNEDLDEKMRKWDSCKNLDDYEQYDWKTEVNLLSEVQKRNLYISPYAWEKESVHETIS